MKFEMISGQMAPAFLNALNANDPSEAALVAMLSARDDTMSIIVMDTDNKLAGYAVFGFDRDDMLTIYAARSINHFMTKVAMKAYFGAAQILGVPVRVHTEKVREMAKMMGATDFIAALDGDKLPMGVFYG